MLYIATDLKDVTWLSYILEEFRRINRAEFDIGIITEKEGRERKGDSIIFYTKDFAGGHSIMNRSDIVPDGSIKKISSDIYILPKTDVDDRRFSSKYDIFWNAFVFLSRLEEYLAEKKGGKIQSYACNHPRIEKESFDIPVVNNVFNELEGVIAGHFSHLAFGGTEKARVELSHDVDYIKKTLQSRIKQTVFNMRNTAKLIFHPLKFFKEIWKTGRFLFSNSNYWCFDYWEDLEKRITGRSVFYIYAKIERQNARTWLLDPSYDVEKDEELQKRLKKLLEQGFEIGLHGSYMSATSGELLRKEKVALENAIGRKVGKVRQHWLRYEEGTTPYLHDKLFKYDSTLAWNDRMGFRSGCLSQYHPYDHRNRTPFSYFETPQIVMDSNIFDYHAQEIDDTVNRAFQMIEKLKEYKTAHVSISWHQRVCSDDYQWKGVYEKLLMNK